MKPTSTKVVERPREREDLLGISMVEVMGRLGFAGLLLERAPSSLWMMELMMAAE